MSGNAVRIGDSISCGDHVAQGSSNVFMGGMPVATTNKNKTTGHGCFPPTVLIGSWSTTVFANNNPIAIRGKTKIAPHRCGKNIHDGVVVTGADSVSIEE